MPHGFAVRSIEQQVVARDNPNMLLTQCHARFPHYLSLPIVANLRSKPMATQTVLFHAPLSRNDVHRLRGLLRSSRYWSTDARMLAQLRDELERRVAAPAADMPRNVVTMRSRVHILDLDTEKTQTF